MVIYSLMLIVLMITRPQGLLGSREITFRLSRLPRPQGGARVSGPLLALEQVTMQFGGLKAIADLDLEIRDRASWSA